MSAVKKAAADVKTSSTGGGFSPRIHPRPQYPSFTSTFLNAAKELFYQSGLVGLVLTLLLFPFFGRSVAFMRAQLGAYGTDQLIFAIIANLVHFFTYVIVNGSFGAFDYYCLFQEYKLSRRPYMKPSGKLLLNTLLQAALGQFLINPVVLYYIYPSLLSLGMLSLDAPLPDYETIFITFCRAYLINGIGFYWAHRLFHSKAIYAYIHKQHHEYSGSMGIAAEYANPIEQVFANILPTLGGVVFWGTHPLIFCVWLFLRLQQTYEAHSGYCFKDTFFDRIGLAHASNASHHDYHHSVNTGNFDPEWMDWICGTQDGFAAGGMHEGYVAKKNIGLMMKKEKL